MITIHKPEGSENTPHEWTLITDTGMHVAAPLKLIPEARENQAEVILFMVEAYNSLFVKSAQQTQEDNV